MRIFRPIFPVLIGLVSPVACAADDIVVTASHLPPTPGDASYATTVISAERLDTSASTRLDDALRRESGFQMFRRSSSSVINASTQGVTLRGLGGNASSRALVTLDGVPLADPFGGWIPWSVLALSDIGSVRITRGGGAVAAGEGALSGSIELTSVPLAEGFSGRGDISYGNFNSVEASERLGWRSGRWAVSLAAVARRSDGYALIAPGQRGTADIAAASNSRSISGRVSYALSSEMTVYASVLVYDETKGNGFVVSNNANRGTDFAVRLVRQPSTGWAMEALAWYKNRNFSSGFASANASRTVVTLNSVQDAVPATGYGGRIEVRPNLPLGWTLRLGGEARFAEGETQERFLPIAARFTKTRFAGGQQRVIGGFGEASATPISALTLTAGGRYDRWEQTQGHRVERLLSSNAITLSNAYPNSAGSEWTGRAGAQFKLSALFTTRAAVYTGWRLPTLNELYRPFRVGTISTESNAALAPEQLRGADVGLVFTPSTRWRGEVTGFANWLDNAIVNTTISTGLGGIINQQRQNVPHARSIGVEAMLHGRLWHGLTFDGSLIYADATIRAPSPLSGKMLAQTPRWQSSVTLSWVRRDDGLRAALTVRHTAAAFDDDLNTRTLPSAVTLDAACRARLMPHVAITLRAENITDARIVTALSTTGVQSVGTPQLFSAGFGFSF